jgi:GTP-sensing pleiotropic transcriptional regulator CodY
METMRKTIGETKAALEFMARIDELDKESRDHFRMVLLQLLDCYDMDDTFGVLLISRKDRPNKILGINCDEMESTALLQEACGLMLDFHTDDMPSKEKLN